MRKNMKLGFIHRLGVAPSLLLVLIQDGGSRREDLRSIAMLVNQIPSDFIQHLSPNFALGMHSPVTRLIHDLVCRWVYIHASRVLYKSVIFSAHVVYYKKL